MDNIQFAIHFDLNDENTTQDLITKLRAAADYFERAQRYVGAQIGHPDADTSGIARNNDGNMIAAWTLE